jgi:hypothetical protein
VVAARIESSLRVAFVSAPGSSVFMVELLAAVAEAVAGLGRVGLEAMTHRGLVSEVADARTVSVVVPHEYFTLAPPEPESLRARTVAFGVEHPGTEEFETSVRYAEGLAARFEISADSIEELARRGIDAVQFPLGLVPAWDSRQEGRDRDVDVAYLGTADPRRIGILARAARHLAGLNTELVFAPHEQMTAARPDFLAGRDKWDLLARSKVLVNLHRGSKTALEWVRVLEAITNGCAVVTEPSDDLGPLRADQHLLVAAPDDVGRAASALARDEPRRAALAEAAHELCRTELDMAAPAARLVDACLQAAAATPAPVHVTPPPVVEPGHHLAVWLPADRGGAWAPPELKPAPVASRDATRTSDGRLAVLCTKLAGDGRVAITTASVGFELPDVAVHVRRGGASAHRGAARNRLVESSDEPFLAVLDGGDTLIGDALERMADLLRRDPGLDAVLCPATYGDTLVNVVLPDERRLRERIYLTRGYVVRRSTLEALGGFTEDPELADLVDHHFWLSLTVGGGRTGMLRRIGLALCPPA